MTITVVKEPKYNLNALTKPSQILRKAAEFLRYDMEDNKGDYQVWRDGCCAAFERVKDEAESKKEKIGYMSSTLKYQSADRLLRKVSQTKRAVDEARTLFNGLFKPKNRGNDTYWFGKERNDTQQLHRITALLTAADIAESQGK